MPQGEISLAHEGTFVGEISLAHEGTFVGEISLTHEGTFVCIHKLYPRLNLTTGRPCPGYKYRGENLPGDNFVSLQRVGAIVQCCATCKWHLWIFLKKLYIKQRSFKVLNVQEKWKENIRKLVVFKINKVKTAGSNESYVLMNQSIHDCYLAI